MASEIDNKYLVFRVEETYAISLAKVEKIIAYHDVTSVPETPAYIAGVINLFGHVVPVISMRTRMGKRERGMDDPAYIIIADIDGTRLGLIVDEVLDMVVIPEETLSAPTHRATTALPLVKAIGALEDDTMVLVLDWDNLLSNDDLEQIAETE
ncbi:chemotaxis protein CheW [Eubacteriales bacterium OttesenSCG-928-A19]|nr:chemotaxis protein CheW [Eubacteriales bacterium OttesenSCG-928-A19]